MATQQITLTPDIEFPEIAAAEAKRFLVMASLKAPELVLDALQERAPISVSAVIDRSGSMSGSKLDLTKATLRFVIKNLTARDEFGIVSYASDVAETLPLIKMDAAGRRRALQAVDELEADGWTNLSGGLFAGIDQLTGIAIPASRTCRTAAHQTRNQTFIVPPSPQQPRKVLPRRPWNAVRQALEQTQPFHQAGPMGPVPPQIFPTPSNAAVPPPLAPAEIVLHIGNECSINTPNAPWKLFVRIGDGVPGAVQDYVQSVEFSVGRTLVVTKAPFELMRVSQNVLEVGVRVKLTAAAGNATRDFAHVVNFASPLTYFTARVPIQQPVPHSPQRPPSPASTPTITTTPPSQPEAVTAPVAPASNDVTALWLFTDGLANEGVTDHAELLRLTKERLRGMARPCTLFTFGFGTDHDAKLLKDLADAGKAMYYFLQTDDGIAEAFADCLGGLMTVVAQGITLTATAEAGLTVHRALTQFEHHVTPTEAWIKLPDLYSEEDRDLIFEVEVQAVNPPTPTPAPAITWRLEYRSTLNNEEHIVTAVSELARPIEAQPAPVHVELDKQRNRVRCVEAMQESKRLADAGSLQQAKQLLNDTINFILASASAADPFCAGLAEDLRDCERQLHSAEAYASLGSKIISQTTSCHSYQRSAGMKQKYSSPAQLAMVQQWHSSAADNM